LYDKVKKQIQKDEDYFGCDNSGERSNEGAGETTQKKRAKSMPATA
jgi:hypothetical protein